MDALTMNALDAQVLRNIAETIVETEVMQPMEAIGWGHGQPPPAAAPIAAVIPNPSAETPKPVGTPTTTVATPAEITAQPTAIDWESLRGKNGLILDKYKSEPEAVKGVSHAVEMAKSALSRAAEVEKENARLREAASKAPTYIPPAVMPVTTTVPVTSANLKKVLAKIVEDGGTIDEAVVGDLEAAWQEEAALIANETVRKVLLEKDTKISEDNKIWNDVDSYMRLHHPESLNFTEEIGLFTQTDDLTNDIVVSLISQGKQRQAAEAAWKNFRQARDMAELSTTHAAAVKTEITLEAGEQVRKEAVQQARVDAGVATTIAAGTHEAPNTGGATREEIAAAAAEMRAGNGERWRALVIGSSLNDPVFN